MSQNSPSQLPNEARTIAPVHGGIMVAHDGSAPARLALRWAAALASRADYELHVVRAWQLMTAPRPANYRDGYMPPLPEWEAAVQASLVSDIGDADLDLAIAPVAHVVYGSAAPRLIASAAKADLLVVGSRGLGGFAGLLLGSVADQCVRHAPCPVTVVRHIVEGHES